MNRIKNLLLCCYSNEGNNKYTNIDVNSFFNNNDSDINNLSNNYLDESVCNNTTKNSKSKNILTYTKTLNNRSSSIDKINKNSVQINFSVDNNKMKPIKNKLNSKLLEIKTNKINQDYITKKNSVKICTMENVNNNIINKNISYDKKDSKNDINNNNLSTINNIINELTIYKNMPSNNISQITDVKNNTIFKNNISNVKTDNKQLKSLSNSNNDCLITDIDVQENPKLELIDVEGNLLNKQRVEINASGIICTDNKSLIKQRSNRDGCCYFGFSNSNNITDKKKLDYILNINSNNLSSNLLFKIYFSKSFKQYFISSNIAEEDKTIVFVRIENKFKITAKHIISLGDIHLSVESNEANGNTLKIDIVSKNETTITKTFNPNTCSIVKIGRKKDNEFVILSNTISNIQTTIIYDKINKCWFIFDGSGNKHSTNGSWIYLNFDWLISENNLYFRIDNNFIHLRKMY